MSLRDAKSGKASLVKQTHSSWSRCRAEKLAAFKQAGPVPSAPPPPPSGSNGAGLPRPAPPRPDPTGLSGLLGKAGEVELWGPRAEQRIKMAQGGSARVTKSLGA